MRPPSLTASQIARLLTVVSFLGSLAANVATGSLPEAWRPHLWWAWPITGLFLLLTVGLTVAERDEESQLQRQRGLVLRRIQADIKQALDSRLPDRNQRIPLHLTSQPRAVMPRPGLRFEWPAQPAQPVPPEKRIDEVFRDASYALLILGAPGAGKTTLLLELAEALAEKAEHDPQAPLPIVLSLDSWAQQKGDLEDWFAREASRVYGIGPTLARNWVAQDALLPLLDGFDEVARERREDCARAINRFRERHGALPIAVCSRKAEYDKLEGRDLLALTGAVVVEPLTDAQITEYLEAGGARLAGLAQARASVPALRELLTTPLMLSVAASAFADRGRQALPFAGAEEAQAQLWAAYVRRMLGRARRGRDAGADDRRRLRYLAWLAGAMAERGLSVFYIERLQPDWLPQRAAGTYRLLAGLADGLAGGLAVGLFSLFGTSTDRTIAIVEVNRWSWRRGLAGGLAGGLAVGWVSDEVDDRHRQRPNEGMRRSVGHAMRAGVLGAVGTLLLAGASTLLSGALGGLGILDALATLAASIAPVFFWLSATVNGGKACMRHLALRIALWRAGAAPWNYAAFLSDAGDRLLMRRVGGGFAFWHLQLRDFLAGWPQERLDELLPETPDLRAIEEE